MRFTSVKELIEYLEEFNPNASILTDLSFSWFKNQFQLPNPNIDKKTTRSLYIYGEYNPHYEENINFYKIKDFIIDKYFTKYPKFKDCVIYFHDEDNEPTVEYYLKYYGELSYKERKQLSYSILTGLYDYCKENEFLDEFFTMSVFIVDKNDREAL